MSQGEVFEQLLIIALCFWFIAFIMVGPPIIRAVRNLSGFENRNTKQLIIDISAIGALCSVETIMLLIRIKNQTPFPIRGSENFILWSIPGILIFIALIFIHIGLIIRRGTTKTKGGALNGNK